MLAVHSPGAAPWRASDAARPLVWWDERGLQSLAKALQDQLTPWCRAWGISCGEAGVRCQPARPLSAFDATWHAFCTGASSQAWLCRPEDNEASLLQALFPGAANCGPLARAVASSCRQDALTCIAAMLALACRDESSPPPDAALLLPGTGAVEAELPTPLGWRLIVGQDVAGHWRRGSSKPTSHAKREPLVDATAALANRSLVLDLELQGCELEVGALQGLQVGDVVRLDHDLHSPAAVRYAGASLCKAYLGRRGHRKAVELAGHVHPAAGEVPR